MALTFTQVRVILRSRLDESSASMWTEAELQDHLFIAENEVLGLLPADALWDIQQVEAQVESSANDLYVTLPDTAAMLKPLRVDLKYDTAAYKRTRIVPPNRASEYAASTTNPVVWFEDGKAYYSPQDDETKTNTLKFYYIQQPTEGSVLVPDRYISLVIDLAYAYAIAREDPALGLQEKQLFYQRMGLINEQYSGRFNLGPDRSL